MAEVLSTLMLKPGARAPEFDLPDAQGARHSLDDLRGPNGLLVMFVCNHCPFVVHLAAELGKLGKELEEVGIGVVAINSNDTQRYAADAPERMMPFANRNGWTFPYLIDEDQSVAKAYAAACTPDFYLFDGELKLTYCGQFDDSRPGNAQPISGKDLREAVRALLVGEPPLQNQRPSSGCNIKWKSGNEPPHFLA